MQELNQQGADFVLFEGFDVIFSLLGEFNKGWNEKNGGGEAIYLTF